MELIKKNIHMDRRKAEARTEFFVDSDVNVPDTKPDIKNIILNKGDVLISESHSASDSVSIKGNLNYSILYTSDDSISHLDCIDGQIPFEEKISVPGMASGDNVYLTGEIQDLTINITNSRKLKIQAIVSIDVVSNELRDIFIPIGVESTSPIEYHLENIDLSKLSLYRDEDYAIKEELLLPSGYPNIHKILWKEMSLREMNFRPMENKIALQGEIFLFIMYEAEGEGAPIYTYETILPISGNIECDICNDQMTSNISYIIQSEKLSVLPDIDGEERSLVAEMNLNILLRLYENEKTNLVTDIYGVGEDVDSTIENTQFDNIYSKTNGRTRISEQLKLPDNSPSVLQILHSTGNAQITETQIVDDGLMISGIFNINILYVTGDDNEPYAYVNGQYPFSYTQEIPGIRDNFDYNTSVHAEQVQVGVLDSVNLDIKTVIVFNTTVFEKQTLDLITAINSQPVNSTIIKSLPSIIIYVVKPEDSLWKIGKKYYVTVDAIKKTNNLDCDLIMPGQKLLIVR